MSAFSLEDFDTHIENLRSQLRFLNETLDATDHNAPDWYATDLISLRNRSGRLQDDMQRFRDQLETEGLGARKKSKGRLSLEGSKTQNPVPNPTPTAMQNPPASIPPDQNEPSAANPAQPGDEYLVQHVDVTEEVNRRLHDSRLRRLMDSPSTAKKRKFDAFEDTRMESGGNTEDETEGLSEKERSPVKKLRFSGTFESGLKRKENGLARGDADERGGERTDHKRRRF